MSFRARLTLVAAAAVALAVVLASIVVWLVVRNQLYRELDTGTRDVSRDGNRIELTRTEFSLLELFLRNPRQVLTRSIIFERVWGYDFGFASNSLDVYIGYLRRKTEAGGKPRLIYTVRGVGYALREA